jgi:hypothetical protein
VYYRRSPESLASQGLRRRRQDRFSANPRPFQRKSKTVSAQIQDRFSANPRPFQRKSKTVSAQGRELFKRKTRAENRKFYFDNNARKGESWKEIYFMNF